MMPPSQSLEMQALPKLREELAEEFEHGTRYHHQAHPIRRNFIITQIVKVKNFIQNTIAFCLTLVFLIPLWFFKIGLKCLDLVERGIRFIIWLNIKSLVTFINLIYRILSFFEITKALRFLQITAKKYFRKYSSDNIPHEQQSLSKLQISTHKKQHQLIDVKKVQQKIKTPNIFISHQGQRKSIIPQNKKQQYREMINYDLVPENKVTQNIVEPSYRMKNPTLMGVSQSHQRIKRALTQPNIFRSARNEWQSSRPQSSQIQNRRISPDRDISPQRYMKQIPKIGEESFKKKYSPERQILMTHHKPIIEGTQQQKQELQNQLITLRAKMSDLINDNNKDIEQLQEWIKQKSQTIQMTRKQNIQLLQQIQQLQKENIRKTKKFSDLQEKIKEMEKILQKQKYEKNGLNAQVQKLEEEIKAKTIQIMSLKQKIKANFEHLQDMQNIFGNQKIQDLKQASQEDGVLIRKNTPENENFLAKSLDNQLKHQQKGQLLKTNKINVDYSNLDTKGSNFNDYQINQYQHVPFETGSQKQIHKISQANENYQQGFSIKTYPLENDLEKQNLEQKIEAENLKMMDLADRVQQVLQNQRQQLNELQHKNQLRTKLLEVETQINKHQGQQQNLNELKEQIQEQLQEKKQENFQQIIEKQSEIEPNQSLAGIMKKKNKKKKR